MMKTRGVGIGLRCGSAGSGAEQAGSLGIGAQVADRRIKRFPQPKVFAAQEIRAAICEKLV